MSETTPAPGSPADEAVAGKKHTAGALDIRNIIGGLLFVYGVILLVLGLFFDAEKTKTGGWNANLWAGIGLIVVGAIFLTWAKLKPLVVPSNPTSDDGADQGAGAGHGAQTAG